MKRNHVKVSSRNSPHFSTHHNLDSDQAWLTVARFPELVLVLLWLAHDVLYNFHDWRHHKTFYLKNVSIPVIFLSFFLWLKLLLQNKFPHVTKPALEPFVYSCSGLLFLLTSQVRSNEENNELGETGGVVQYGCNLLSRANVARNHVMKGKIARVGMNMKNERSFETKWCHLWTKHSKWK